MVGLRRYVKPEKYEFVRRLRENLTSSESKLEKALRKKPFGFKTKFRSQVIIWGWIYDIFKIMIELGYLKRKGNRYEVVEK